MAKKINYAELFTLRSDGRYQKYVILDGKRKAIYDRDPERLYQKCEALENPTAPTFKAAAEAWHDEHWKKIRAGTKVYYGPAYKRALEQQKGRLITEVSPSDINNHLLALAAKGYASKTVSAQRSVYNLVFNYAIVSEEPWLKGWVTLNPTASVRVPRGLPKTRRQAPEDDVVEIIRQNIDKPFGIFPIFALCTGFRKAEIIAVTWGDIDFKAGTINCNKAADLSEGTGNKTPKTDAGIRTVPLLDDLRAVLKRPKAAKNTDNVFQFEGHQLTGAKYDSNWLSWCRSVGLTKIIVEKRGKRNGKPYTVNSTRPNLGAHQLRHGYATLLFESGVDVYTAQKLLGHANIETTMGIYTQLREKQKIKSLQKLQDYMSETYKPINVVKMLSDEPAPIENTDV